MVAKADSLFHERRAVVLVHELGIALDANKVSNNA